MSLLVFAALVGLFSCDNDPGKSNQGGTKTTDELAITINADLSLDLSRAPGDGRADDIDRYTLLVYTEGVAEPCVKKINSKTEGGSFSFHLVRGLNYTIAVWADCSTGPYTVGNDGTVSMDHTAFRISDENCDAFFGTVPLTNVQNSVVKSITLGRPFGQLNIKAEDYETAVDNGLTPNGIEVTLSDVYTRFNILTGEVSGQQEVKSTAAVTGKNLSFSYLFAPTTDNYTIDVCAKISFASSTGQCDIDVPEVKIKRNYRTIIDGDILTKSGEITVTLNSEFNGNETIGVPVRISGVSRSFSTINEALTYMQNNPGVGTKKIIITGGTYNEDITLPAGVTLQGAGASTVLTGLMTLNEGSTLKNLKHTMTSSPVTPYGTITVAGSNVTLQGVELTGPAKKTDGSNSIGVCSVSGVSGLTVKDCIFTGYWKGLYIDNSAGLSITGSEFVNINPFGVDIFDKSMTVTGNIFRRSSSFDAQMIHLLVTNLDGSSPDPSSWSPELRSVVNQIIGENTWPGKGSRMRVQCKTGTAFDNNNVKAVIPIP